MIIITIDCHTGPVIDIFNMQMARPGIFRRLNIFFERCRINSIEIEGRFYLVRHDRI